MASNEVYLQGSKVQQFNNWGALVKDKERLESVYENATKVDQNALSEKQRIQGIWQRVAEDYAPFDVDVTTELREDVQQGFREGPVIEEHERLDGHESFFPRPERVAIPLLVWFRRKVPHRHCKGARSWVAAPPGFRQSAVSTRFLPLRFAR